MNRFYQKVSRVAFISSKSKIWYILVGSWRSNRAFPKKEGEISSWAVLRIDIKAGCRSRRRAVEHIVLSLVGADPMHVVVAVAANVACMHSVLRTTIARNASEGHWIEHWLTTASTTTAVQRKRDGVRVHDAHAPCKASTRLYYQSHASYKSKMPCFQSPGSLYGLPLIRWYKLLSWSRITLFVDLLR